MKKFIFICISILFIACSKKKNNSIINTEDNKNVEINEEKPTEIKGKFYDSYEDYLIAKERYLLIKEKLDGYLANNTAKINVLGSYDEFTIVSNKMFLEETIPGYENIPEHYAIEEYDINWEENGKFTYISFDYNGKLLSKDTQHGYKKYLLLFENRNRASLYDQNNKMVYLISSIKIYTLFRLYCSSIIWIIGKQ